MNFLELFKRAEEESPLSVAYHELLKEQGKLRQREMADKLSVSEAEIVDGQLGVKSIRLTPDFPSLLQALPDIGYIMNLTRNPFAVHERKGCYQNVRVTGPMGLVIANDKKIDLRLFLSHWKHVFAVKEETKQGDRHSLQFYDRAGTAIQKIYLQPESSLEHYLQLLNKFVSTEQETPLEILPEPAKKPFANKDDVDKESLINDWKAMTDVHQFIHLLRKHNVDRQDAFQLVGNEYAEAFAPEMLQKLLTTIAETELPIMCFVGNQSAIQIFSGTIQTVKPLGPWLNILDPEFNLHLLESGIAHAWVVRKPTVDGIVTSLEFYDAEGNQVVQFFGKRAEGQDENTQWRELAESVTKTNIAA